MAGRIKALSLYRSILRAHDRFLPNELRQLGDAYVKSEFRLHKNAKTEQANEFIIEWEKYLTHVEQTGRETQSIELGLLDPPSTAAVGSNDGSTGKSSFGRDVSQEVEFSEEQQGQLGKLREEAVKAGGKTP